MPLDGTTYKPKIKPLETGLAGLKQIGDRLRLPLDHEWDFQIAARGCDSAGCAILTTKFAWPNQVRYASCDAVSEVLEIPRHDLDSLFGMSNTYTVYGKLHNLITPTDVADAIDRYIAGKEAA